jgi:hypothetical protein
MEALHSSKTSVLTTASLHNFSEDVILQSHCCEKLEPYMVKEVYLMGAIKKLHNITTVEGKPLN